MCIDVIEAIERRGGLKRRSLGPGRDATGQPRPVDAADLEAPLPESRVSRLGERPESRGEGRQRGGALVLARGKRQATDFLAAVVTVKITVDSPHLAK